MEAVRQRETGSTYLKIGEELGVSKPEAHRLVKEAAEERRTLALSVERPRGRDEKPTDQRGLRLLLRLELDFRRLFELAGYHFNPGAPWPESGVIPENLREDFEEALEHVGRRLGGSRDWRNALNQEEPKRVRPKPSTGALLGRIEASFAKLLDLVAKRDEVLRDEVDAMEVLEFFQRDLRELGGVLGAKEWPAGELSQQAKPGSQASKPSKVPLTPEQRRRRDERIVLLRLKGTPVQEVAKTFGIKARTVRRVMEGHRRGRSRGVREAHELTEKLIETHKKELDALSEAIKEAPEDKRLDLVKQRVARSFELVALMRNAGLMSPEAWATHVSERESERVLVIDWTAATNRRVRRALEEYGAELKLIEVAVEAVVAGLREGSGNGGEDIVQSWTRPP